MFGISRVYQLFFSFKLPYFYAVIRRPNTQLYHTFTQLYAYILLPNTQLYEDQAARAQLFGDMNAISRMLTHNAFDILIIFIR